MRRRVFLGILGCAVTWPIALQAQSAERVRVLGILNILGPDDPEAKARTTVFEQTLQQLGWVVGRDLKIETREVGGDLDHLRPYAAELVALAPDVILSIGTSSIGPLQQATRTIPIVFMNVSDSLAHPEGNITGFVAFEFSIGSKWIGLLKQLVPDLANVAIMSNPVTSPQSGFHLKSVQTAAPALGVDVTSLPIHSETEIEPAIAGFTRQSNGGLVIAGDSFLARNAKIVVEAAAKYRLPAVYANPEFMHAGGLMSYTFDFADQFRGAAYYVDRILKGARPGDLPVQFPTKYKLVISLKAAKALGLEVPMSMMLTADEVVD
jgi:putative ABC transport system substrate-binding protein